MAYPRICMHGGHAINGPEDEYSGQCKRCKARSNAERQKREWHAGFDERAVRRHTLKPVGHRRTDPTKGYVFVKIASNDWRYEHVVIMEGIIGRRIQRGETVHHINGVKDDNRPENLELWVSTHPGGQRVIDLVAWAHEVIDRYGAIAAGEQLRLLEEDAA